MNALKKMAYAILITACLAGCTTTEGGSEARRGAGYGAAGGAVLGLALGATTGNGSYALAGAAAGAIAGGAAGGMYMYDQSRDDKRTKMLADSLGGAQKGETVETAGKRHLDDFLGEWNISAWAMRADGTKINGTGKAKVIMDTKESAQFSFIDIVAEGVTQDVDGGAVLGYSEQNGFTLACTSTVYSGTRNYVGEYVPQNNEYNFYPVNAASEAGSTGVVRSNIKLTVRASGNMISIATFSMIDGQEVQIQSYRFTK
ncbi:MAG: hypothetical protein OCC46_09645 [Pseudodesulfovibrio sp.]